jgi:cystathionine beta-lyase/cystathionine gamma-synthase
VYSRLSAPNSTRFESILSSLLRGNAVTYASGLAAFHALLVYYRPNVIAISGGYHGCHGVITILTKLYGLKTVDLYDEAAWDAVGLGKGDVVHVESPLNPTGEAVDLAYYAARAHERGAVLTVDATFGPPPLQDPFLQGADAVMHSGSKYFGGHSDMLCGVLVTQKKEVWEGLWKERMYIGGVMGNLEGWLGVRSLRTLEVRVLGQSRGCEELVKWIQGSLTNREEKVTDEIEAIRKVVLKVQHASLQTQALEDGWLKKQMPGGYGPVFSLYLKDPEIARRLPSKLHLFHHATSLGGVESLIEWRKMSDSGVDERLLRVSVGLENWEDLKKDLLNGFRDSYKGVHSAESAVMAEKVGNGA